MRPAFNIMSYTITYQHTTETDVIICHGLAYIGQTGYFTGPLGEHTVETIWLVDPNETIESDNASPLDRGNAQHSFNLAVERRFATIEDARIFCDSFAGTLPRGDVSLEVTDTDAGKIITYAVATLQKLTCVRAGLSVDIYFTFQTSVPVLTDIPEV